jgi:Zn-finger nucleic acid-binding protein
MSNEQISKGIYNCPNCGAAATPESVRCAYCHSGLATLVCSKCYGAVFIGMKHCPWCGEAAETGKAVESSEGKCPRCSVDMVLVKVSTKILCECPACGGLWVDQDTLQEICTSQEQQQAVLGFNPQPIQAISADAVPSTRTYIPCPKCSKLMNRRQFAGGAHVIIDYCKMHGTWFDRNELRQIVQFILDGGLAVSREREKLQLEEARQNLREERRNLERIARLGSDQDFSVSSKSFDRDLFSILGGICRSLKGD